MQGSQQDNAETSCPWQGPAVLGSSANGKPVPQLQIEDQSLLRSIEGPCDLRQNANASLWYTCQWRSKQISTLPVDLPGATFHDGCNTTSCGPVPRASQGPLACEAKSLTMGRSADPKPPPCAGMQIQKPRHGQVCRSKTSPWAGMQIQKPHYGQVCRSRNLTMGRYADVKPHHGQVCRGGIDLAQAAREAKARELDAPVFVQQDVAGLQVAVDGAPAVQELQRGGHVPAKVVDGGLGQPDVGAQQRHQVPPHAVLQHQPQMLGCLVPAACNGRLALGFRIRV